jgi:hypothetical protein
MKKSKDEKMKKAIRSKDEKSNPIQSEKNVYKIRSDAKIRNPIRT